MSDIKTVLSLDLSLCHTGWAIYQVADGNFTYGVIEPAKELGDLARMDVVISWVKAHTPPGTIVFIEGLANAARGNVIQQMAGLGYLVRYTLMKQGTQFHLVTPNQAKKYLTGRHQADKNIVLKEVFKRYALDIDDDNIADAVNINFIGRSVLGLYAMTNEPQREVVAALTSIKAPKVKKKKLKLVA